jgi:hypothetical protein
MNMYQTFTRTWWRNNPRYPNGLEPGAGRKTYYNTWATQEGARKECKAWNDTHNPGRLGRKMEYESV